MNIAFEKRLGKTIRLLREKSGMTQETLSIKLQVCGCDITRSAMAKIEVAQRHVYPDELFWLSKILKVSADELLGGIEDSDEKI